jgi:hypothetical protein
MGGTLSQLSVLLISGLFLLWVLLVASFILIRIRQRRRMAQRNAKGLVSTILVRCKNSACEARSDPIRLPCPTETKTSLGRLWRPRDVQPLFAACPQCGLVSIYQPSAWVFDSIDRGDLAVFLLHHAALSALRPCGLENCEARIEILTVVDSGLSLTEIYPIIPSWRFAGGYACPAGPPPHCLTGVLPPDSYDLKFVDY